jgi:hypothetical protein
MIFLPILIARLLEPLSVCTTNFTVFRDSKLCSPSFAVHQDDNKSMTQIRPLPALHNTGEQHGVNDSSESAKSDDLMLFGGVAEPGEPTMTSNAFDRLNLGTRRTTVRGKTIPIKLLHGS